MRMPPQVHSPDLAQQVRVQRIVNARHQVVEAYCKAKGWPCDPEQLSMAQIMEIRALPEWQSAGKP